MEILKVVCFLLIYNMNNVYVNCRYIESRDYYWRDYTGIVPRDAVEAGKTNGSEIYIGQVLVPNVSAVLPGIIYRRKMSAIIAYAGTTESASNVKILCSKNVELLRWINVTETSFPAPSDLVYGGVQSNIRAYIGRIVYKDNIVIGKAFDKNSLWKEGLYVPVEGGEQLVQNYQILAHRPPLQDYYWRNYEGYVPDDAIEGGVQSRSSTYIGQVLILGYYGIIPANIEPGNKTALTIYDGDAYLGSNQVKILCSQHKEKFNWIPSSDTDFPKTENVVVGGEDSYGINYICRVNYEGDDVIGLVRPPSPRHKGCYAPTKGAAQKIFHSFDVLAYKT